jgi:hypothetical protein
MTLLDTYYPYDTGPGASATVSRWRGMARTFANTGIVPGYGNQLAPSLAGSVVTINTGACWIDGFYGEVITTKTISVSGNGMVVARMDPTARTISFVFVPNQTSPTQSLTGIYEIPLMQITGTTGRDIRQIANPFPSISHTVVSQNIFTAVTSWGWGQTGWAGWWQVNFNKVRPETVFDFVYHGSGYSTSGGWAEIGCALTAPAASSIGQLSHFYYNTLSEHHSQGGALVGWGTEITNSGATGPCSAVLYVRTGASTWNMYVDGNDKHTIQVIERMP